ncbi:MAG: nucleotide exchange factor GrpE [Planctomycetota bacterium]|nr:nucleotide exchange factor GrpE [Planctomycetota bacterium]
MSKRSRKDRKGDEAAKPAENRAPEADTDLSDMEQVELSEEALQLVGRLEGERDEAIAARQRALADLVNYQRRAVENERHARRDGRADVVRSLLPALDNFDLALAQDPGQISMQQLHHGVRMVREELGRALESHGVRLIAPEVGAEFDPNEHRAVMRQATDEHEPNTIVAVLQVGYVMDGLILRPASVSVAAPIEENDEDQE